MAIKAKSYQLVNHYLAIKKPEPKLWFFNFIVLTTVVHDALHGDQVSFVL